MPQLVANLLQLLLATTPLPAPDIMTAASPGITRMTRKTIAATPNRVTKPVANVGRYTPNIRHVPGVQTFEPDVGPSACWRRDRGSASQPLTNFV